MKLLSGISVRSLMAGCRARRRYFAADAQSGTARKVLATSADPVDRMQALWEWADAELAMAENTHGFPGYRERDEDGFTLAASLDLVARLLGRVADTEAALWWGGDAPDGDGGGAPVVYGLTLPLGDSAVAALALLETEADPVVRADLVLALYEAVVDMVGGQAAEALAALASYYLELAGLSRKDIQRRVWTKRGEH